MEVPVTCHGNFLYSVLVNVTPGEHESILKHKWYKRKGQPVAHGAGNLFNFVSNLRKQAENLLPINLKGRVVTFARVDAEDYNSHAIFSKLGQLCEMQRSGKPTGNPPLA